MCNFHVGKVKAQCLVRWNAKAVVLCQKIIIILVRMCVCCEEEKYLVQNQLSITDIWLHCLCYKVPSCISISHSWQQYLIIESVQLLCLTHTLCGPSVFEGKVF